MSTSHLLAYAYSLAIGLLMGAERERSHVEVDDKAFGIRTFALLSLLGTVAAQLGDWVVAGVLFFVSLLLVASYRRTNRDDPGTTTETSAMAAFLLGVLSFHDAGLAAALAIAITAVLFSKQRLHSFIRNIVTDVELGDALKFFIVAFVVLPLLPNRSLGPYGVLNPERIWFIVVMLTGISWVGYIAVRSLGPRRGLVATGLASGFVSATATTVTFARIARTSTLTSPAVAGAQLASVATYVQLIIIMTVVSPTLAARLIAPAGAGSTVLVAATWLQYRRTRGNQKDSNDADTARSEHPFALLPAFVLTAILTTALLGARWATAVFGSGSAVIVAGAAGLADAHGGSLSAATLFGQGELSMATTLAAIGAAMGMNTVVKCVLSFVAGGAKFGRPFTIGVLSSITAFVGVLWIVTP